jgi:hypothetical protein
VDAFVQQTNARKAYGEATWFRRLDADVKSATIASAIALVTVTKKPDHREERGISRKTIARGMPGVSGVTVVTSLVCFLLSHARLRAH